MKINITCAACRLLEEADNKMRIEITDPEPASLLALIPPEKYIRNMTEERIFAEIKRMHEHADTQGNEGSK